MNLLNKLIKFLGIIVFGFSVIWGFSMVVIELTGNANSPNISIKINKENMRILSDTSQVIRTISLPQKDEEKKIPWWVVLVLALIIFSGLIYMYKRNSFIKDSLFRDRESGDDKEGMNHD